MTKFLIIFVLGFGSIGLSGDNVTGNPNPIIIGDRQAPGSSVRPSPSKKPSPSPSPRFRCDGRIHCSQMGSYEEALFFLRNCPGVKMDGDDDGIPCEQQFRKGGVKGLNSRPDCAK